MKKEARNLKNDANKGEKKKDLNDDDVPVVVATRVVKGKRGARAGR